MVKGVGIKRICLVPVDANPLAFHRLRRGGGLDDPAQAAQINKEIWTYAKHSSYSALQIYIKKSQAKANHAHQMVLPTGWAIAPAGSQLELGRMPTRRASPSRGNW